MTIWFWIGFVVFVLAMLALDLGVFHRRAHVVSIREALGWTAMWVAISLLFNVLVYFMYEHHWLGIGLEIGNTLGGRRAAVDFFTGYIIEKSLSLDNIFVIALIFSYFGVPAERQHRVLFWGILGALVMRGAMILIGVALIRRFDWITYVFGGLLLFAAFKMLVSGSGHVDPDNNWLVRLTRKLYPVSRGFEGNHFFTRIDGRRAITPLLLVLLVIESTDLLFAVDSIPAVFAITNDAFIVFTSNVFAILGLRSLYFALAGMIRKFRYLNLSLVAVLAFVGVKMILANDPDWHISTEVSLLVIGAVLLLGLLASVIQARKGILDAAGPIAVDIEYLATLTFKQARRIIIFVVGISVVVIGIVLLFLPGPAFIVIPLGLAILATEFAWARRLLKKLKDEGTNLAGAVFGTRTRHASKGDTPSGENRLPPSETGTGRETGPESPTSRPKP